MSDSEEEDREIEEKTTGDAETEGAKRKRKRKRKQKEEIASSETKAPPKASKSTRGEKMSGETTAFTNSRTVYIEGLPFSATEDDLKSFFSECGRITSIRLPKWHDSGRLRGYGHIEFSADEAAAKAFDLDGILSIHFIVPCGVEY